MRVVDERDNVLDPDDVTWTTHRADGDGAGEVAFECRQCGLLVRAWVDYPPELADLTGYTIKCQCGAAYSVEV